VPIRPVEEQILLDDPDNSWRLPLSERDPLPWGQRVYAVSGFKNRDYGVNLTFAKCDEATKGSLIKSIVHRPDGHGYRNWDSNGDILY
jgi:hypothetical protein